VLSPKEAGEETMIEKVNHSKHDSDYEIDDPTPLHKDLL